MRKNKSLFFGCVMLAVLVVMGFIGPQLPFIDTELKEEVVRFQGDQILEPPYPPSLHNLLGSDPMGRDLLSLIVMGTNNILAIVFVIALIRYLIAVPLGFAASKGTGPAHWLIHAWNRVFSSFPTLFAAIFLMNIPFIIFSENRLTLSVVFLARIEVGRVAYIVQQQSSDLSQTLYVQASRMMGTPPPGIYYHHYMPVLSTEIIVNFFLDMGRAMLLVGQLGLFGIYIAQKFVQTNFGTGELRNTSINWATILGQSRESFFIAPWYTFFPAIMIAFAIIAFNLTGEGLRKYFSR
ncbi:MAG TPA: ABC transporter permease subunit [Bacillales bacterium]